ncbi:MAG: serine/threonine protein kinase [Bdellovibrio sp. ArHS]|uniref:outer membrane protein assembly factor BamB family protein n=1 Tax=Bdellovibrio sp. ArHS TaxID=1569284 RepID=UPI000583B4B6|nr:PQQ-binding-like beta-propeller repeat protein [Bdellovibrio sp. ArHS]KHD87860.1 MAG: serine/threonine protein kinase [Bdellovibrio sp. ArHS]
MKKYVFAFYCLVILLLLAHAEVKTWPLLDSGLRLQKPSYPVKSEVLQYDLSTEEKKESSSTYRRDNRRSGHQELEGTHFAPFALQWRVAEVNNGIHRASKSSPAADEQGFYVADDTGFLRAYDWQGKLRWQFYSGVSPRGMHSTPLTDKDSVYVGDYAGYIYSLNKETGKIRWLTKAGSTIGSSPFLHDGLLYVGVELPDPEGFLLALEARTGKWVWTSPLIGNQPHSSPTLDVANAQILMGSNTGAMSAYDIKDGKPKWSFTTNDDIKCAAALSGANAYFTSWDGFLYSINTTSGVLQWRRPLDGSAMSCPSINKDGTLIAVTGFKKNFVITAKDGKVLWSADIKEQSSRAQSSPFIISYQYQEVVVFLCEEKSICLQDLNTGKILQQIKMESTFSGSPVYFKNHLFIATSGADGLLILKN